MKSQVKKELRKLGNKQFIEDVKKYIRSSYEFHTTRVPELKVLAKRLHEEYDLEDFYKVFNRLWKSSYNKEIALAIFALQQYKEEFDMGTWEFIKPKIKDLKTLDQADSFSIILGHIALKNNLIENEILKLSKSNNIILKRIGVGAVIPLVQNENIELAFKISEENLYNNYDYLQKAIGQVLKEIGQKNPERLKKFILKHSNMPFTTFSIATENMKELRRIREIKSLKNFGLLNLRNNLLQNSAGKLGKIIFKKRKEK